MTKTPFIVGLGGTTRPGSTSERALRAALDHAEAIGCRSEMFVGARLPAEIYDPTRTDRSGEARALVAALRDADGIVIATPSYHGGISGLVKNALDFTEDLARDTRVYLEGRAVGCIVCADGAQAMGATLASMRAIVHALRGWPTPYGATLNAAERPFGGDGANADAGALEACRLVAEQVVDFARMALAARA